MHSEPANVGGAEEGMEAIEVQDLEENPVPHMTGTVMEGTEAVST